MPSQLEREIARTRRLVDQADAATRSRVIALYEVAIEGLDAALARTAGIPLEEMTPGQLYVDMRYRQLLAEAEMVFAQLTAGTEPVLMNGRTAGARIGQEQAIPMMRAAAPEVLSATFVRLPEAALQELIGTIGPRSPVRAVLDGYGANAADIIEREFIQGISQGKNSRVVARNIRKATNTKKSRWQIETLARNETLRPFRAATLQTYANHKHILDGWQWSAAKSVRTCLACLSLDGDVFPLTETFMPTHPACRCSASPYRKGGPGDGRQTGAEWFEKQDEATKRKMLPKSAWGDYAAGRLRIDDFVQRDTDPIWGPSMRESSVKSAIARARRRPIPEPGKFTDINQAKRWADQTYSHIEWEFAGAHIDAINPTLAQFHALAQEWPDVAARLKRFGTRSGYDWGENTWAVASRNGEWIGINPARYGKPDLLLAELKQSVKSGWHPIGSDSIESIMTHEFGHQVYNFLASRGPVAFRPHVNNSGFGLVSDTVRYWEGKQRATKSLSMYATTEPAEAWAESFAALYHTPKAKWTTYTHRQRLLLDEMGGTDAWTSDFTWTSDLPTQEERTAANRELIALVERLIR